MDTEVHMRRKLELYLLVTYCSIICCDIWNVLSFLEIYFPLCPIAFIAFRSRFEDQQTDIN
jgi:hypothetical protein